MLNKFSFILCFFLFTQGYSQPFFEELYGFQLGQTKASTHRQLGEPIHSGIYSDTVTFETFSLSPDSSFRITFTYLPRDTGTINSIKLFGFSDKVIFNGLKLGDKEEVLKKMAGKPEFKVSQEYPVKGERWEYWQSNFVLETTLQNKLYSVKIKDVTPELYVEYSRDILPKFSQILQAFSSGDRKAMLPYIAPGFYATAKEGDYFFAYPVGEELMRDTSHVFALLSHPEVGIPSLLKAKKGEIIEKLIFDKKKPPVLIYKCAEPFRIKEIELIYFMGSYRIRSIIYRE
ncbi:MAG: hypothetical protein K1X92_08780 [Bacteroidia bacterium]|nr:hypothetical protein [Bacteroidia bacterium]